MRAPVVIVSAVAAGSAVLALTQAVSYVWEVPMATFVRDVQANADVPWYTGAISVLNSMIWTNVAALSLFVAWQDPVRHRRLAMFGVFALALAADDALLLHDAVGPNNGVPQEAFLIVYAVVAVLMSRSMLHYPDRAVVVAFVLGAAFLASWVVLDQLFEGQHLLTGGTKLLGALVWLTLPIIASQPACCGGRASNRAEPSRPTL